MTKPDRWARGAAWAKGPLIAGSLFSGIEGLGLGLLWSGLVTSIAFQVELDPLCRRVLAAHFPLADRSVSDVRAATASNLPRVDCLFFGSPCQDLSAAGAGEGLTGERSGLWFDGLRVIAELEPPVVLFENVASGARRWVCPVRGGLEALGYRTRARSLGVDECGGTHRRRRIFVIAYSDALGRALRIQPGRRRGEGGKEASEHRGARPGADRATHREAVGARLDGVPDGLARYPAPLSSPQFEWEPLRGDSAAPLTVEEQRALGNAVSPIQAYQAGLWAIGVLREWGVRLCNV